ncbi:voltage-gated potassium channel [Thalassospira mesophila]|uniref:Voltage-gated potassium channel n=1 Tax=Thalassospira mesophila TaxID=1293891 RepID=A0A1Y2L802_9PROT|nr:voltage-gated potassium channel [Thalassospira mesophila]
MKNQFQRIPRRVIDLFIQLMIVLSIIEFSIETLPDISNETRRLLSAFEIFSVTVFTIEYIARVVFSKDKKAFIFSFFGIVDLLAILPFYLSTGLDLRSIRAFRLLRLIRILKLARYSKAMKRLHLAFMIAKEEIVLFTFVSLLMIYLSGVGIYYFENPAQPDSFKSIFHSLWWAVATLTTVGYGDIYPITVGGKIFTFLILIVGLGIVSIPAGIVASALSKAREMED